MEAYSHEYPNTRLLSMIGRDWFQHNEGMHYRLDNYCLMLDKVTNYLKSIGDMARLDLVRRCFYLKVCDGLSHPKDDHSPERRREQMSQLVSYWGWSQDKLYQLDHRHEWKIEEVKIAHAELLEALMQSYRNLIQFARRNNISESINPEDIGILSRKLYAAFESLPGKVQRINLKIAPDLSEPDLSFVQVPHGRLNRAGWYLYKHSLEPVDIIGRAPLEFNGYISKLVSWAYFNDSADTPVAGAPVQSGVGSAHRQSAPVLPRSLRLLPRKVPAGHQSGAQPTVRNSPALHLPQSGDGPDQSLGRSGDRI